MSTASNNLYTIHCVGDSLTEGFSYNEQGGLTFYPYTDFIPSFLSENLQAKIKPIHNYGVSGDTTLQIQLRFNFLKEEKQILVDKRTEDEKSTTPNPRTNEIFVFLAGTNDLGQNRSPEETFGTLYEMTFDCINAGSKVIVCSIPSLKQIPDGSNSRAVSVRDEYNERLKMIAEEMGSRVCLFFDCHKATGTVVMDEVANKEYTTLNPQLAADNLHLTKEGYQVIAKGVSECLDKFLA